MSPVSAGTIEHAIVKRVDENSLGYLNVEGHSLPFAPECIENYGGQAFVELGITEGVTVGFVRDAQGRISVIYPPKGEQEYDDEESEELIAANSSQSQQAPDPPLQLDLPGQNDDQSELLPNAVPLRKIRAGRALPDKTRAFGRLIDTSQLQAGDLLLSRNPLGENWISDLIADVQGRIGYGQSDARWSHVAMYLGNGSHVVEATVDSLMAGGDVRITHLDNYSDGTNILRFRRSTSIREEKEGWWVCVEALSQLGKPYSVGQTLRTWYDMRFGSVLAYDPEQENVLAGAIVCSTLYAGAFNRALRLSLGEVNGICVPAWFSATNEFMDINVGWLQFAQ